MITPAKPEKSGSNSSKTYLVKIVILLIGFFVFGLLALRFGDFLSSQRGISSLPTDEQLISNLLRNEKDFLRLKNMCADDLKSHRIYHPHTYINRSSSLAYTNLTHKQLNEYHQLFKKLEIQEGVECDQEAVYFRASSRSLGLFGSSEKGYWNTPHVPSNLLETLDKRPNHYVGGKRLIKKVKGNWYLYYIESESLKPTA